MDPTARNDDPQSPDDPSSSSGDNSPNPIQPGQFVVAGEEASQNTTSTHDPQVLNNPDLTASNQPPPVQTSPIGSSPQLAKDTRQNFAGSAPLQSPSAAGTNVENIPQQANPPPSPPTNASKLQATSAQNPPPETEVNQPDPTPFIQPQQAQGAAQMGGPSEPSKIEKLKIILIIAAALVLIATIAALVWFFILNKKGNESVKTELTQEQVEEPSPPAKRTTGGFGELPPATPEATQAASPSPETSPTIP